MWWFKKEKKEKVAARYVYAVLLVKGEDMKIKLLNENAFKNRINTYTDDGWKYLSYGMMIPVHALNVEKQHGK